MRKTKSLLVLMALVSTMIIAAANTAPAVGVTPSCRASVARVDNLLGMDIEPFVANRPSAPCVAARTGLIPETTIGPVVAAVAAGQTFYDDATKNSRAQSTILGLSIPSLPLSAVAVFASANSICGETNTFTAGSVVVGLNLFGTIIEIPPGHSHITVP